MIITRYRLAALFIAFAFSGAARAEVAPLLQLIDYVGVDYREAVRDGAVINDAEYAEMREFGARISTLVRLLPDGAARGELQALASQLETQIDGRVEPAQVAALTRDLRSRVMAEYEIALTPRAAPDLARARELYAARCAACHGAAGGGNGPAASGLDPPPIDFLDTERARERSLFGLFNTITLGVNGTSMTGFGDLPDSDRWALAFYVAGLAPLDSGQSGADAWRREPVPLQTAVTLSPAELAELRDDGEALSGWMRRNPGELFAAAPEPLELAVRKLDESLALFRSGEHARAQQAAISAYLEGFELVEAGLRNVAPGLVRETETAMMAYRHALEDTRDADVVTQRYGTAAGLLARAREALAGPALSPAVAFTSSLIILLREGLEAILILAAMAAFLIRADRRDGIAWVHAGWIAALLLGLATWAASSYLVAISGSTREMTEGFTALVAAAILFYVGFWMHRNASAQSWNRYLQKTMQSALGRQTLWTIAAVSFLAVYREVFETVLFYQALWLQVGAGGGNAVLLGAAAATVILLVVAWMILQFGSRLPLRQFFIGSTVLMVLLAVVLSGKGVAALQEAGMLPINPLAMPTIELLGMYPNVQVIVLQAALLLIAGVLLVREHRRG